MGYQWKALDLKHNAKEKEISSDDCSLGKKGEITNSDKIFCCNYFGNNYLGFRCFHYYMENNYLEVISYLEKVVK